MNQPITDCERMEWSRCAQAMYRTGHNAAGHALSAAAATMNGGTIPLATFDRLGQIYRAWLVFNEYPTE